MSIWVEFFVIMDPSMENCNVSINMEMLPHFRKFFRFDRADAPLLEYLRRKIVSVSDQQRLFMLMEIVLHLRQLIFASSAELVDALNPEMILCDPELETALGVKVFHIRQLAKLVKKQLTETEYWIDYRACPQGLLDGLRSGSDSTRRRYHEQRARRQPPDFTFVEMYIPNPLLHSLLFPRDVYTGQVYKYSDILCALVRYFHANQHLIVSDNPSVALIKDDPLSAALGGVSAFHSDQVEHLLKKNMVLDSVVFEDL